MSPKNSLLKVGLAALGLCGFAPSGAADPPEPVPTGPAVPEAPSSSYAVLQLTNSRGVLKGTVTFDGAVYTVSTMAGKIPVRKHDVEIVCKSIEELYRYKRAQFPEADAYEHLKLARWCLAQGLKGEAKQELHAVLRLSSKEPEAKAMLGMIGGEEDRRARRDPAIARAGAERRDDQPETPSRAVLEKGFRALGISGLPQIPGLPQATAVKRVEVFRASVHPILQIYCARCHNENYPGTFQLVPTKPNRAPSPDALRANLDSVLALVNQQSPEKSELLSITLRPHGAGQNKRPIFRGSNDLSYQILLGWVNSLRPTRPTAPDRETARLPVDDGPEGEGFATNRPGVPLPLTPVPPAYAPGFAPPGVQPGQPAGAGGDPQFPVPYLMGGPKPTIGAPTAAPQPKAPAGTRDTQIRASAGQSLPALPDPPPTTDVKGKDAAAAKPKRTPSKIDPALLQKALMNRYAQPQQ